MKNNNKNGIIVFLDTNFTLFSLKLQADRIKNGNQLKDSLHSLLNFVDAANLRAANP